MSTLTYRPLSGGSDVCLAKVILTAAGAYYGPSGQEQVTEVFAPYILRGRGVRSSLSGSYPEDRRFKSDLSYQMLQ